MKRTVAGAACLAFVAAGLPPTTYAKGALFPVYHAKPCSGEECRADDARSGEPCTGFLCSFVSAKAMRPPVTASQAAAIAKAQQEADITATIPAAALKTPPKTRTVVKHKHTTTAKPTPSEPVTAEAAK